MFGGYFGGPGGGGGPGARSVDVFISVRVELPDNWVDMSSVQALAAVVSHEVEEQTGLHVIDVGSTLVPQAPYTIIVTGSLFGGALQCPFYHEKQIGSHCGLHVVNMLLGRRHYTRDSFIQLVHDLHTEAMVSWTTFCTSSGDYSQDVLQTALVRVVGAAYNDGSFALLPVDSAIAVERLSDDDFCALVIQYDANHALLKSAHW